MFVAPWSPDFSPDQPQLTYAVNPVELRGLPYYLFNKQSLSRITTAIGKPVSLAPETERKENFEVARVWVRVNLLAELQARIVSGFNNGREVEITVSYPWLPSQCHACGKYGHEQSVCAQVPANNGRGNITARSGTSAGSVRSRSCEKKARSSSRPSRSFHTCRQENVVYRVKENSSPKLADDAAIPVRLLGNTDPPQRDESLIKDYVPKENEQGD